MSFPGSLKRARAAEAGESHTNTRTHARKPKPVSEVITVSRSQIRGRFSHFLSKRTGHATNKRARAHT